MSVRKVVNAAADGVAGWLSNYVSVGLLGVGITMAPSEFFGGFFLALSAATVIWRRTPSEARDGYLGAMFTSCVIVISVAALCNYRWPDMPAQLPMIGAGFLSSFLVRALMRVGGRIEGESINIFDRLLDVFIPKKGG